MKFQIDKNTITLAMQDEAKNMLTEYRRYAKDGVINDLIQSAISANAGQIKEGSSFLNIEKILEIAECNITINRGHLTALIVCTVKVDYRTIVEMLFDGMEAMVYGETGKVEAYIQVYRKNI